MIQDLGVQMTAAEVLRCVVNRDKWWKHINSIAKYRLVTNASMYTL